MAVQFELYKTPMPKEKKNKTRYHTIFLSKTQSPCKKQGLKEPHQ